MATANTLARVELHPPTGDQPAVPGAARAVHPRSGPRRAGSTQARVRRPGAQSFRSAGRAEQYRGALQPPDEKMARRR